MVPGDLAFFLSLSLSLCIICPFKKFVSLFSIHVKWKTKTKRREREKKKTFRRRITSISKNCLDLGLITHYKQFDGSLFMWLTYNNSWYWRIVHNIPLHVRIVLVEEKKSTAQKKNWIESHQCSRMLKHVTTKLKIKAIESTHTNIYTRG